MTVTAGQKPPYEEETVVPTFSQSSIQFHKKEKAKENSIAIFNF